MQTFIKTWEISFNRRDRNPQQENILPPHTARLGTEVTRGPRLDPVGRQLPPEQQGRNILGSATILMGVFISFPVYLSVGQSAASKSKQKQNHRTKRLEKASEIRPSL